MTHRSATTPAPPLPGKAPVIVTQTRQSALSVTRFAACADAHEPAVATMPVDDAFVVLYQLRDHAPHEFWHDDKLTQVGALPSGTLNIVDLNGKPYSHLIEPVDTLMFHLPRAALDEIAEDAGVSRVSSLVATDAWHTSDRVVGNLHEVVIDALASGAPTNRLFFDHLLFGLAAHFAATYGGLRPVVGARGGLAPWQQRRAQELLAANLAKEVSLTEIAAECGLSTAYFSRAFKRSTRSTPHAWLQMRRIDRAKQLLATAMPLSEIAVACGFADQSHFTRIFSRSTSLTPRTWQRQF